MIQFKCISINYYINKGKNYIQENKLMVIFKIKQVLLNYNDMRN